MEGPSGGQELMVSGTPARGVGAEAPPPGFVHGPGGEETSGEQVGARATVRGRWSVEGSEQVAAATA